MSDVSTPTTLLIVGDVRLFRDALASALGQYPEFTLIGSAQSSEALLQVLTTRIPDLVVFDASMSGILDLVRACSQIHPAIRFVAVAVTELEQNVVACAEAGVAGYVPREGSVEELVRALEHARRGELLCSPRVAGSLFRRIAALSNSSAVPVHLELGTLTQREEEIAVLLDSGLSNKEIARRLCIEVATVKNHVHSILEKLHVRRRGEAAARRRGAGSSPRT